MLRALKLANCKSLKRFPSLCIFSLEYLRLQECSSLENFPEILGSLNCVIRDLFLRGLENLVTIPSSISKFKSLVELDVSDCSKLETLPDEIGDLKNLEKLDARYTLISQPPPSIVRLNKLKFLSFAKQKSEVGLEDGVCFVFPQVNEGLRSLAHLDLSYCNLIDGGLPEDIGYLSSLKVVDLSGNNFEHLPQSISQLGALRFLDLTNCKRLKVMPDFMGTPNLKILYLSNCMNLEEVTHSLGFFKKLGRLELANCKCLKSFPGLYIDYLEYLSLQNCSSLEKFPEICGKMNFGIRNLDLRGLENLVTLTSSICKLKCLVSLDVSGCAKLESFPEAIGDLENLEKLDASATLISQPPPSIVRLNKLKFLSFAKQKSELGLENGVYFVFPPVDEGLRSLEILNLSYCNLIDGGLPEDIGCLSSLKELKLRGNNFEHLPGSIAQLGALRSLDLADCKRLTQLPGLPPELETFHADWNRDSIYTLFAHTLYQNVSSMQQDISASDSLSQRVFTVEHPGKKIPSWFHYQGMDRSVLVNLPDNWYICDNFLGFAVCCSGSLIETTAQLIPLCDDGGMSWMTQKLALWNHSKYDRESTMHFFFIPLAGLWDASMANGKTPNDYGLIRLSFSGEMKEFGLRLLYKDEPELEALSQSRLSNEASCSLGHLIISVGALLLRLCRNK